MKRCIPHFSLSLALTAVLALAVFFLLEPAGVAADDMHTITGFALTDDSTPIPVANAQIVAQRVGSEDMLTAFTDAAGAYTLQAPVEIATWRVSAAKTEATTPANVAAPAGEQIVVFNRLSPQVRQADFTFSRLSSSVQGQVLISGTLAAPTFPVTVSLIKGIGDTYSTPIDASGGFQVGVPAGSYQLTVAPDDLTYLPPLPQAVEVLDGQTVDVGALYLTPLTIGQTGRLTGAVQTPAEVGVSGVEVVAYKLDGISETLKSRLPLESSSGANSVSTASLPIARTTTAGDGSFSLIVQPGTWWVAAVLGSADAYMPHGLQWQAIASVEADSDSESILLVIDEANAVLDGTVVSSASGEPATDACGVVAVYEAGDPTVYNTHFFTGGTFELPVVTGTYRLVLAPDPGVETPPALYPEECKAGQGKYLVTTLYDVAVDSAGVTPLTISVEEASSTIHGQLWNEELDEPVVGVAGQMFGWGQGAWSAAQIDTSTGAGDLRASEGDWVVAYHVDHDSGYEVQPGVVQANVPAGVADVDVHLQVASSQGAISGQVVDPAGTGVRGALVLAVGVGADGPIASAKMSDEAGAFQMALPLAVYQVMVIGPAELLEQNDWISPEAQRMTLSETTPAVNLVLRYRSGDPNANPAATRLHGHLIVPASAQTAEAERPIVPALVWAATAGAHNKTWVADVDVEEYELSLLQGQKWTVGAVYQVGSSVWIVQTVLDVLPGQTDLAVDLTLSQPYTLATSLVQTVKSRASTYVELSDGFALNIPAGAFSELRATLLVEPSVTAALGHSGIREVWLSGGESMGSAAGTMAAEGVALLGPVYQVTVSDMQGDDIAALNVPMMLQIPYDLSVLSAAGLTPDDIQVAYFNPDADGWMLLDGYIVDQTAGQVIVSAEALGGYGLISVTSYGKTVLPIMLR